MQYDLLIKNGFIVDGTGNPGYRGDLLVDEGKIIGLGRGIEAGVKEVIDAAGRVVAPGFIDPHVHEELTVLKSRTFEVFLRQGVTTTVNGNCGHSITPYSSANIFDYMYHNGLMSAAAREEFPEDVAGWHNFAEYRAQLNKHGMNINMGFLLGHGTIRWSVMKEPQDREPTTDEYATMKRLIREGMEQGALGISTGLAYIPGRFADTEELIELAAVAGEYDGIYTSHIRQQQGELAGVREVIEIGEEAEVRCQVSHLSPTTPGAFREILAAREGGLEIAVDTIPRSSGHLKRKDRMLQFIMSSSAELFGKGIEGVREALETAEGREIILDVLENEDKLLVVNTGDEGMENRSIKDIAADRGLEPDELLLELMAGDNQQLTFWQEGLQKEEFPGIPRDDDIAGNPLVMVGSDRIFGEPDDPYAWYELFRPGAFPLFFAAMKEYGLRIEEIVRRVTSLPAQQFRLYDRGLLSPGKAADIVIIDPDSYSYPSEEEIDYRDPLTMAEGVEYVIVNGRLVLAGDKIRESYPGRVLTGAGR